MGFLKKSGIPPEALIAMGSQMMGTAGTPGQYGALGQAGSTLAQFMMAQRQQEEERRRQDEERQYRQERMDLERQRFDETQRNNLANDPLKMHLMQKNEETKNRIENFQSLPEDLQNEMRPFLRSPDYWDALSKFTRPPDEKYIGTARGLYHATGGNGEIIKGTEPLPNMGGGGYARINWQTGKIFDPRTGQVTDAPNYTPPDPMEADFGDLRLALDSALRQRDKLVERIYQYGGQVHDQPGDAGREVKTYEDAVKAARQETPDLFARIDEISSRLSRHNTQTGATAPGGQPEDVVIPPAVMAIIPPDRRQGLTQEDLAALKKAIQEQGVEAVIAKLKEKYGG